jgi:hypothetical protein
VQITKAFLLCAGCNCRGARLQQQPQTECHCKELHTTKQTPKTHHHFSHCAQPFLSAPSSVTSNILATCPEGFHPKTLVMPADGKKQINVTKTNAKDLWEK